VIVTTLLTSLGAYGHHAIALVVLLEALAVAANIGMYFASFRVLTPKGVLARELVPGAVAGGVAWTVVQALGTYLVHHFLRSDSVDGVFATVLGLLAWIYLGVEITVYAAETNVALARRLRPRSIVQPAPHPGPTGPSWRLRHCKTSGATTSTSTCRMTTGQPAPRRRVRPRGPPMRSRGPRRPGQAAALTNRAGTYHEHAWPSPL
jgi:Virulence factor BrkB